MKAISLKALRALFFVCATAVPLLLPVTAIPDAVIYHQIVGFGCWGLVLLVTFSGLCFSSEEAQPSSNVVSIPLAIATPAGTGALLYSWHSATEQTSGTFLLLSAVVLIAGATRSHAGSRPWIAIGWWLAGVLSVAVAALQYFAPQLADGGFVAPNRYPGRAVGNVRQPNHLATALVCAMVMTAWLWQAGRLRALFAGASIAAMVFAVALSASRTGAVSLGVLVLWAIVDKRLPRATRWLLALTPVIYLACWAGLTEYAALQNNQFYGAERLQSGGDISSSRFAIWKNALTLIAMHPWTGVGWGRFNFAWTFTPFPDRPVAFFDHTHNLPLQLAVEIGLPATVAVLGLFGWALWRARGAWNAGGPDAISAAQAPARAAFVLLAVLAVHSLLEYPLWYAYFLLPAAWALGIFLGAAPPRAGEALAPAGPTAHPPRVDWTASLLRLAGSAMVVGALYAAWDHRRIEAIFAPAPGAAALDVRIADGRRSVLFGHHADYAAVTNEPLDQRLESFRRPLLQLVDVRLLIAYIGALRANGRDAEALYAAQRLREFDREDAQAYFKDCDGPAPPFQCGRSPVRLTWKDLLPP